MTSVNDNPCVVFVTPGLTSHSNGEKHIIWLFSECPIDEFCLIFSSIKAVSLQLGRGVATVVLLQDRL